MSSSLEHQSLKRQLAGSVSDANKASGPMRAVDRFARYKELTRKLAHHISGTGEAITKEERGELREITKW